MSTKITHGELLEAARDVPTVDPDEHDTPADLRAAMSDEITQCRWCGDEFVHGWTGRFCSDTCEVAYINEYHR